MKKILILPLVLALAACASMDPDSPRAPLLDAGVLGARDDSRVDWPTATWWTRYQDAQLNALMDAATAGSPSLVAAQARLTRAQAAVASANALLLPRLDASGTATRLRYTENGAIPMPLAGATRTDARLALNLSYDLDFWNKNGAALKAIVSQAQAAQAEQHAAANLLTSSVASTYFNLQRLFSQQAVLEAAITQRSEVVELTRQRYAGGLDTQVEVKQAESALAQARTDKTQVDEALALTRNQLAALTAGGPQLAASLQKTTSRPPLGTVPADVPLSLLGHRADVVAARLRVQAAERGVDVAKASFYPEVNLAGFLGVSSLGLDNLLRSGSLVAGLGPAITLPIFEGGQLNANLKGRQADIDLAIASYNQTVIDAVHEVSDALESIRALSATSQEQTQARLAIEQAYDLALRRYRGGLGNYLTVLSAQSAVLAQNRLDADLKARSYTLDVALAKALGGGVPLPDLPDTTAALPR